MMRRRSWASILRYVALTIRDLRERRGWRQVDLANAAGLHFGVVVRIENRTNATLPLRELWALANALGVRVADVLPPDSPLRAR